VLSTGEKVLTEALTIEPIVSEGRDHVEAPKKRQAEPSRVNASDNRRDTNVSGSNRDTIVNHTRTIQVTATAYTAFCNTGCTGITATGVDVSNTIYHEGRRIVAVDPNVIPLGTKMTLRLANGSTIEAIAEDTGGAIDGHRIDVLMGSRDKAITFGRQQLEAVIH